MTAPGMASTKSVFNPPPGWPAPADPDWLPPAGWLPDPSWPQPPTGWALVVQVRAEVGYLAAAEPDTAGPRGSRGRTLVLALALLLVYALGNALHIPYVSGALMAVFGGLVMHSGVKAERSRRLTGHPDATFTKMTFLAGSLFIALALAIIVSG